MSNGRSSARLVPGGSSAARAAVRSVRLSAAGGWLAAGVSGGRPGLCSRLFL